MKIFKFYPPRFERMYYVAKDITHAKTMGDKLFAKYIEPNDWFDEDELADLKVSFLDGFRFIEEDDLGFVDGHY
jgi:hypothetical protein